VQVDSPLQKAPRSSQITLGREKEVNRVALAINGAIQVFQIEGLQWSGMYFGNAAFAANRGWRLPTSF
jgi:hypothetical protein